jgi:hypothetical protein
MLRHYYNLDISHQHLERSMACFESQCHTVKHCQLSSQIYSSMMRQNYHFDISHLYLKAQLSSFSIDLVKQHIRHFLHRTLHFNKYFFSFDYSHYKCLALAELEDGVCAVFDKILLFKLSSLFCSSTS